MKTTSSSNLGTTTNYPGSFDVVSLERSRRMLKDLETGYDRFHPQPFLIILFDVTKPLHSIASDCTTRHKRMVFLRPDYYISEFSSYCP